MAGQVDMGAILGEQLLNAAKMMEEQVDQEIANLEKMDEDELEVIKRRRIGKVNETELFSCELFRNDEEASGEKGRMEEARTWGIPGDP